MVVASSCTGQGALQELPSKSEITKRTVASYVLPDQLIHERVGLKGDQAGLPVLKVTKHGKLQSRRLAFTPDRQNIIVTTNRIKSVRGLFKAATGREASAKLIPLDAVDRIERGHNTKRFLTLETSDLREYVEDQADCLSIVYFSNETHTLETLDLIVTEREAYEILLSALEELLTLEKEERLLDVRSIQLLKYQWQQMKKEYEIPISLSEWMHLTERVGVPLSRSTLNNMFKEDCIQHSAAEEFLTLPQVAALLEDVKEASAGDFYEDPLGVVWDEIVRTDPVPLINIDEDDDASLELDIMDLEESISVVAFLSFIRSHQKEYKATLEQVTDILDRLNRQRTPEDLMGAKGNSKRHALGSAERLTKTRFYNYLQSDTNDLMNPGEAKTGIQDMSRPLSDYWICTSHDTYLATLPPSLSGKSAYAKLKGFPETVEEQMYTAALMRGVRCLEVDVWDGPNREPFVARHEPLSITGDKCIPLLVVLRSIGNFLHQFPNSFPVILKLENHCSTAVQLKIAKMIQEYLGSKQLVVEPSKELEAKITLPSPEEARGMVIIMGKRPKELAPGSKVLNDDFDDENGAWCTDGDSGESLAFDPDEEENKPGTIVGFDDKGPIRSDDPNAFVRSPAEMVDMLQREASSAQTEASQAKIRTIQLEDEAAAKDKEAAMLADKSGISMAEVERRAARAANRSREFEEAEEVHHGEEEKNTKDEGIEVHDVLQDFVEGGRDRYAQAAQEAMEATNRVNTYLAKYKGAEDALRGAQMDLERSRQRERNIAEEARRAAAEARSHREYADSAKMRVEKVRELLRDSKETATSAGTVVQTALTEAKISEKRAADAEARASRASATADKDRHRAEEETRKEEELENQASDLHAKYTEMTEVARTARERVEKAAAMLERVNEQIKLIESSSQYKKEIEQGVSSGDSTSSPRHGGSFVAKHAAKLEEREICRELIKEASEENSTAENERNKIQHELEEITHLWRIQADLAAQMRKVADRSSHVADELVEHAEEEREAANLRHTARQKAEANVQNRDSQKVSLQTQLAEAERAVTEATSFSMQSRKRADRLAQEAEKSKDHTRLLRVVEEKRWVRNEAKGEYEAAKAEQERRDLVANEEKRRLDTNMDVYNSAVRGAETHTSRIEIQPLYQQEAIVAFNQALMFREQARDASRKYEAATAVAKKKSLAATRAQEYKNIMDRTIEIPATLAKLTYFHTLKHKSWEKSLKLSGAHAHSFAQHALSHGFASDPEEQRRYFDSFTKNHLVRTFPSWTHIQRKSIANDDPVFPWSLGCQLVSMNLHSVDEKVLVADGRFRQNGSCGYVLKPDSLIESSSKTPASQLWVFEILAGFNLPKPVGRRSSHCSPFVKVALFTGIPEKAPTVHKTNPVKHNRINPVWKKENSFSYVVENPTIAVLAFSVWNQVGEGTAEFIAGSAVPASCLREGFRSVALYDAQHCRNGPYAYASLLVKATRK